MPRRPTTHQFDLFSSPPDGKAPRIPRWQTLPEEARKALATMMARLILSHCGSGSASQRKEARHDA